jgi:hypothetical protein
VTDSITIRRPDDWHLHLRDGDMLSAVLPWSARQFARAIVMPNLDPPVTDSAKAAAYRDRIRAALPDGAAFEPLMTCYLTDRTDPDDLARGHAEGVFTAAKLYPAGATTNSAHGVSDIAKLRPVLARMERIGMPLLVHGEVTDPGHRHLRPRGSVPRARSGADAGRLPGAADRPRACHDGGRRRLRRGRPARHRRDDHAAAPDPQPQRAVRRGAEAACLLPAGREARAPPPGVAARGNVRLGALLSRDGQRAA